MVEQTVTVPEVESLREVFRRATALTEQFTPEVLERQTPCALWKVRDLLAHNATAGLDVVDFLDKVCRDEPTIGYDIHTQAQRSQRGVDRERNRPDIIAFFRQSGEALLAAYDRVVAAGKIDQEFNFFTRLTPREFAAIGAFDVATHMWDYGKATGRTILPDPRMLENAVPAMFEAVLPRLFEKEAAGDLVCSYGIKLNDLPNGEWVVGIDHGKIRVERRPINDARVRTTASTANFLLLMYGRIKPIPAILTGKVKSRGNPLLAMKFDKLFTKV